MTKASGGMVFDVIGDEITVDGRTIARLVEGVSGTMFQNICDTLRGVTLDDFDNDGPLQEIHELEKESLRMASEMDEEASAKEDLKSAKAELAEALRERDEARTFGEKLLKDHTAWIVWARSMGYVP